MGRSIIGFTLLFFLWALAGCNGEDADYLVSGSFEANTVLVSSEGNGRVTEWTLREGDAVEAGCTVGYIDSVNLYLQKMALLASAKGVRAESPDIDTQTGAIQEQIRKLETEQDRMQRLVAADVANRKQLEDIDAQILVLRRQLTALSSSLSKSSARISAQSSALEIQVAQLDYQLSKCAISSPISGVVLQNFIEQGELASVGVPLFQVADLSTLYLRAYFPYNALAYVKLGDTVRVRVDDGESQMKEYAGSIVWISAEAEFTPKMIQTKSERDNLVYAVKVAVPNDGYLKIGMYGEMHISR